MEKEDLQTSQELLDDAIGDILTFYFGVEFWKKGEPKNVTSYYDGSFDLYSHSDLWRQKWFAKEELTQKVDDFIRYFTFVN